MDEYENIPWLAKLIFTIIIILLFYALIYRSLYIRIFPSHRGLTGSDVITFLTEKSSTFHKYIYNKEMEISEISCISQLQE